MSNNHAPIQNFLQQQTVISLTGNEAAPAHITKAGIIPFMRKGEELVFYTMKPLPSHRELGDPEFQLCKGTRMIKTTAGWKDMRGKFEDGEHEPLILTALREGIEELGLVLTNIRQLYDVGMHEFFSATTGKRKQMSLFAAEMAAADQFLSADAVAETTAQRRWLSAAEFAIVGRKDHTYILNAIAQKLLKL